MVELVGMAVEEGEDGLQLWQSLLGDVHNARLVCLDHGQRSGGTAVAATDAAGG